MRSKIADQIMKDTPQELKDKVRESSATFIAVESYKKALRERIEYEIAYHERTGPMAQESRSNEIAMLKWFLTLIEKAEPPKTPK